MPCQTVLNECLGFVEKVICLFVSRKICGKSPLNIYLYIYIYCSYIWNHHFLCIFVKTTVSYVFFVHLKLFSNPIQGVDDLHRVVLRCVGDHSSWWCTSAGAGWNPATPRVPWIRIHWNVSGIFSSLGIQSPSENGFLEPKHLAEEVIIHPNHHLTRWLDP